MGATSTPTDHRVIIWAVPRQHGAWAFLAVPLLVGLALSGWSLIGVWFAIGWLLAYPASYYLGRAVVVRWRRNSWTRAARRALQRAAPWAAGAAVIASVLVLLRPWLLPVGGALAMAWVASLWLSRHGRERGMANDLLLVSQAALAVPLLVAVSIDGVPPQEAWLAGGVVLVFFVGSVLHVKSLIRGSGDRRWALASRGYHGAALAVGLVSPWLLLPFGTAAVRAFAVPPGTRPAVIGAVEAGVSALVVVGVALALG